MSAEPSDKVSQGIDLERFRRQVDSHLHSWPQSELLALLDALDRLSELADRDFNHDGFGMPEPVLEADCRTCQVLARFDFRHPNQETGS